MAAVTFAANETNSLADSGIVHTDVDRSVSYDLSDRRVVKIARLRLLSDPAFPFWDLSYCYGELADGTLVPVTLPRYQFPKRTLKGDLIAMCKEAGRYGKGMGLFDALSTCQ